MNLICGDSLTELKKLDAGIVQTCITSPPYWGLRVYGTPEHVWGGDPSCQHEWETAPPRRRRRVTDTKDQDRKQASNSGAQHNLPETASCRRCGAWRGELGLEPTPALFIEHLVGVFREVRRVLKKDGTLWVVIGDSFASGKGACHNPGGGKSSWGKRRKATGAYPLNRGNISQLKKSNLKPKDLVGIPWLLGLALRADGWWLRMDIIWSKKNPMSESVMDRPTRSHEYILFLTKSKNYYFDMESIMEKAVTPVGDKSGHRFGGVKDKGVEGFTLRSGKKWKPKMGGGGQGFRGHSGNRRADGKPYYLRHKRSVWEVATAPTKEGHFATYPPKLIEPCILAGSKKGDIVLDPFIGTGTTALVAEQKGRRWIGIELNPEYIEIARKRLRCLQPEMFV